MGKGVLRKQETVFLLFRQKRWTGNTRGDGTKSWYELNSWIEKKTYVDKTSKEKFVMKIVKKPNLPPVFRKGYLKLTSWHRPLRKILTICGTKKLLPDTLPYLESRKKNCHQIRNNFSTPNFFKRNGNTRSNIFTEMLTKAKNNGGGK